ncbi:solute carrier family 35 member C2-like isoform X2 [Oncorhynchus masou masou]|uniref:solute carrier family 35 member C2-like isoform X2 n=1 Tax=Oncorhynchus masou masou TaxID=90313 RepID=UPI003182D9B8
MLDWEASGCGELDRLPLQGCPSRYTMIKSSVVLFILFFSLVCKLEELEVCTLLQAGDLMGDRMSGLNWMSFAVCVSGIALHLGLKTYYSISKIHSLRLLAIENSPDLELPLLRQKEDEGEETATEDNDEEQEILL